ncbi:MAG: hypothetical protein U0M53_01255, partial [Oscillospiraceae bacterium]|nr:hypothetical protein [Oscillospiraceae bacterium]
MTEPETPETEPEQPETEPQTAYAVTNNKNSDTNNLRDAVNGSVLSEVPNGVLLELGESTTDEGGNLWYAVTVVESGLSGYMRDYLVTQITYEDAQSRLEAMGQGQTGEPEQPEEPETEPEQPETEPEQPETEPEEPETEPEQPEQGEGTYATTFPSYGITVEQSDNAYLILFTAPGAAPPQSGAIPKISEPTPLELSSLTHSADGVAWYLARNMNTNEEGYIQAYNVRLVSKEEAEAAVDPNAATPIPPAETEKPEETPEPDPTPSPTPVPQELTAGDVYHYGRNTGAQVALRKSPDANSENLITRLEAGTIVWVMQCTEGDLEDAWCLVRTNNMEGYMMAKFVQLMGVEEEAEYRASLDDPEVAPQPTEEPTAEPTEEPTPDPTDSPEPTATPAPQQMQAYGRVVQDNAPMRANPEESAYLQKMLTAESVVSISQSLMGSDGTMWYLVQYDGEWGYIKTDLVRLMGEQETKDYLAQLEAANATPTPTAEPTPTPVPTATPAPQDMRVYARVINDGTPLRGNPDANAYLQTILNKDT